MHFVLLELQYLVLKFASILLRICKKGWQLVSWAAAVELSSSCWAEQQLVSWPAAASRIIYCLVGQAQEGGWGGEREGSSHQASTETPTLERMHHKPNLLNSNFLKRVMVAKNHLKLTVHSLSYHNPLHPPYIPHIHSLSSWTLSKYRSCQPFLPDHDREAYSASLNGQ